MITVRATTAFAVVLCAAICTVRPAHADDASEPNYKNEIGLAASVTGKSPFVASAGVSVSHAPWAFFAAGAELSTFKLGGTGEACMYDRVCVSDGWMLLPFGEVRTPWTSPVNVFARLSVGGALANVNDGSHKLLAIVRGAAGPELRVSHLYFRPFVSVSNKLVSWQRGQIGVGAEIGAAF
jgi:hypothetical protein